MGVELGGVWFIMRGEPVEGVCMGINMEGWWCKDLLGGWSSMYDYGLVYDRYWVGRMVMVVDLGLFGLGG